MGHTISKIADISKDIIEAQAPEVVENPELDDFDTAIRSQEDLLFEDEEYIASRDQMKNYLRDF